MSCNSKLEKRGNPWFYGLRRVSAVSRETREMPQNTPKSALFDPFCPRVYICFSEETAGFLHQDVRSSSAMSLVVSGSQCMLFTASTLRRSRFKPLQSSLLVSDSSPFSTAYSDDSSGTDLCFGMIVEASGPACIIFFKTMVKGLLSEDHGGRRSVDTGLQWPWQQARSQNLLVRESHIRSHCAGNAISA